MARHGDDVPEDERVLPDDTDEVKKAKEEKAKVLLSSSCRTYRLACMTATVPYAVGRLGGAASLAHRCASLATPSLLTNCRASPPLPTHPSAPCLGTHSV